MKTIGIFANCEKPSAAAVLKRLDKRGQQLGLRLMATESTAALMPRARKVTQAEFIHQIDLLMVLGGDGTMLNAVRLLQGRDVPVLGINLGSLGFLTSLAQEDIDKAIRHLAQGKFSTSRRSLADCNVRRAGRIVSRYRALNDIVIDRGASARIITLNLLLDEEEVSSYRADGLIVSTPTGSTGHSVSAGGPILHPKTRAFVINLICPHTLSARPLVIPDEKRIAVEIARSAGELPLSIDGQIGEALKIGDRVEIRRSARCIRFIHPPDYNYFAVLRQKLHWRGSAIV